MHPHRYVYVVTESPLADEPFLLVSHESSAWSAAMSLWRDPELYLAPDDAYCGLDDWERGPAGLLSIYGPLDDDYAEDLLSTTPPYYIGVPWDPSLARDVLDDYRDDGPGYDLDHESIYYQMGGQLLLARWRGDIEPLLQTSDGAEIYVDPSDREKFWRVTGNTTDPDCCSPIDAERISPAEAAALLIAGVAPAVREAARTRLRKRSANRKAKNRQRVEQQAAALSEPFDLLNSCVGSHLCAIAARLPRAASRCASGDDDLQTITAQIGVLSDRADDAGIALLGVLAAMGGAR